MMILSFHHLTLEPQKINAKIENKEKRKIKEHCLALECEKNFIEAGLLPSQYPNSYRNKLPDLEDALEQVVVKNWGNIISVYPIIATSYQEHNITWLMNKYDLRKNSITQKYGSIILYWEDEILQIGFIDKEILFQRKKYKLISLILILKSIHYKNLRQEICLTPYSSRMWQFSRMA